MLCLTPHIPVDENDERSAFSILLLHTDWGVGGEAALLGECTSAVERLRNIKDTLKPHVLRSLQKRANSETMLANAGHPHNTGIEITMADFDQYIQDQRDDEYDKNTG